MQNTPQHWSTWLIQAYIYNGESGECAALLLNNDNATTVVVQFQNSSYELPSTSISILPDCKNVAFNTAKASFGALIFIIFKSQKLLGSIKHAQLDERMFGLKGVHDTSTYSLNLLNSRRNVGNINSFTKN